MTSQRVLVTGGSGFIAGRCILQLLEQGHFVRATIRSLVNEATARGVLRDAGMVHSERLSFVAADLLRDDGWAEAVAAWTSSCTSPRRFSLAGSPTRTP